MVHNTLHQLAQTFRTTAGRGLLFLRLHRELTMILFLSFTMKLFLAPWNSYWFDELLSIYAYGIVHDNVFDALRELAETSIHPPLYQFVLYLWIEIFGHTEGMTRTLSTLYVTLATLFLYLFALRLFGRRTAVAASLFFAFSSSAIQFSLETRSYGQSLFLVTLSSYCLLRYIEHLQARDIGWRNILMSRAFLWLVLSNVGLLFTHYFNIFFLAAQGFFLLLWLFWKAPKSNALAGLLKAVSGYAVVLLVFLLVWGQHFFSRSNATRDRFESDVPAYIPTEMLSIFLWQNLNVFLPRVVFTLIGLLFVVTLWRSLFASGAIVWRGRKLRIQPAEQHHIQSLLQVYILFWLILPFVFAYLGFLVISFDRYLTRYFVFVAPALMMALVLAFEEGIRLTDILVRRLTRSSIWPYYRANATLFAFAAAIVLVAPMGCAAANYQKHDWRGIARHVVDTVNYDHDHRYIVYDTGPRSQSSFDYYLERYHESLRVYDVVSRAEEQALAAGENITPQILGQEAVIAAYDYLILIFTHELAINYPNIRRLLEDRYPVHYAQLSQEGRGFIVYRVKGAESSSITLGTSSDSEP